MMLFINVWFIQYECICRKEKIQLKNNGLWKFDLQTGNKEKIREQSPKELHVLGNKVYDETLKEVC